MIASKLTEQPIIQKKAQSFNYGGLKSDIRFVVEQRTSEIKTILRRNTLDILEIGQKLIEVKDKLGHGHFLDWIEAEFKLDERTARRYMSAAEVFGLKSDTVSDLDITPTALYVLAAPSTPDSARTEALSRAKAGEPITPTIAKTIVNEHRPTTTTKRKKAAKQVTVDTLAQTVEHNSSSEPSVDIKPVKTKHTQLSHKMADISVEVLEVEPTRYATALQTVEEVDNNPDRAAQNEQKLSRKEAPPRVLPLQTSAQSEEVAGAETYVGSVEKENSEKQTSLELPETLLDEHREVIEVFEVTSGKSGNGHLNPPTDVTLVLPDTERNDSDLASVGDLPHANPPGAKASNKMSEIRKLLNQAQHFTDEEIGDVFELLLYHIGVENFTNLFVKSIHEYERVNLCHKCFAVMTKEAFSSLEVERINISSLNSSAIEYLAEESKRVLSERHAT